MTKRRRPTPKPLISRWLGILAFTPAYTLAAPVAGQFIEGSGSISHSGLTTTITQTSQQASLNWQGFNIAPNETVRFLQPSASAIAVNRIFDTNGSQLLGQLQANGQVWLINPNGVLFGAGAQVNVGALLASTLDFKDSKLNDNTRNFSGNGKGSVINLGSIETAPGGFVAMLANQVSNQGNIIAQLGTVALGAGSAVTLSFNGNSLVRMQVDQSVLDSLAKNGGLIRADGGLVLMSAGARDSLLASVVNNSGIIEAHTVTEQTGGIILLGGMQAGSLQLSGTLDASAPNGGNGGHIETSAALVKIADTVHISTAAANGKFGIWLIDPKDFTVATSGSDFNAAALSASLETTSVELQSSHGAGTGTGNVNINAAIGWTANSSLTLTASNNVNVNANITATGNTAGLVINPNTSNGGESASGSGSFNLRSGVSITLAGVNPSLVIAGQPYTVINGLSALQNMNLNTSAHYALGSNINAADTLSWNDRRGFMPIGSSGPLFTGTLDGLGHSVNNLSIDQLTFGAVTANVGLIGSAGIGSVIRNIGVVNGSIKGGAGTGGLVGSNLTGSISNSYFTGTVTGGAGTGGLIGSTISGSIFKSYAVGNVNGAAGTGGLVGSSTSGNISQSYHTGNVTGAAGTGGLVGSVTSGSIENSYSIGSITGQAGAGGLTGSVTSGKVKTSFAVGTVTGAAGTGALLGATSGPVVFSYWDNEIGPATSVGGGTGLTSAQMRDQSNFVGFDFNTIWSAFSGGLPGLKSLMTEVVVTANSVSKTYNGVAYAGGNGVSYSALPGGAMPTGLTFSGSSQGAVNASGISYAITPGGLVSSQAVRYIFVDGSLTILPLAVNLSGSRAYDGSLNMLASAMTIGGLIGSDTLSLSGVGTLTSKNVGSGKSVSIGSLAFGNAGSGLSSNYIISDSAIYANITQVAITLASSSVTKTYDGGLTAAGSAVVTNGSLMNGDSLTGGSFAFTDKNVGSGTKVVSTSGVTVGDGTHNNNYTVSYATNTASTINAAALTLSTNAVTKTYDGGLTASGSTIITSGSLMNGDSLTGGSFAFTDKNVGSGTKAVSTSGVTVGDGTHNNNYTVSYANNTASTINAAAITLTSSAVTKTYDGGLTASGSTIITSGSLMNGDSLTGGSFAFTDKNVGSGTKTVSTSGVTVGDGTHNNNYTVSYANNTASTINAAAITLASSAVTKTYDGGLNAAGSAVVTNGSLMNGDSLTGGSFAFTDKNVGSGTKTVSTSGVTVGDGTHNNNYTVSYANNTASTINAAALTLSSNAVSKTYDGGLTATGNAVVTSGSLKNGDSLTGGSFAFTDKNVGSGTKVVSTSGVTVGDGTHNNNYTVSYANNTASTINTAAITLASSAVTKTYDGGLTAAGSAVVTNGSLMNGDSLTGGSFAFTDKNVGSGTKVVSTSGVTVGDGTHNNNYTVSYANNTASTINAAALTLSSNAVSKTYDGGLTATGNAVVTSGSLKNGDSLTGGSFAFTDKNVGSGTKVVSTSGVTVGDGTHNNNYTVSYANNNASTISAASITLASNSVTKTYDGGLTAAGSAVVTNGSLMSGDSLSGGSFSFTDKNVGTGTKTVSTSGVTVGDGVHNNNYAVSYADNTASTIHVANVIVYDVRVGNKVADGNVLAALGGTADVDGLGGDILTVGGTGVGRFTDALVGNTKPVTITGFTLIGTYAGNYNIVQPFGLTANITAAGTSNPPIQPSTSNPETHLLISTIPALLVAGQNPPNDNPKTLAISLTTNVACDGAYSSNYQNGTNVPMGPTTSLTNCGVNLPAEVVRIR